MGVGFDLGGNVMGGPGHIEGGMDWGLGPEGSEGVRVGHSERKAGEDRDVSPLGQKQAFMQAGVPSSPSVLNLDASSIMKNVSIPSLSGMKQFYLDDEFSEKFRKNAPVPGIGEWAKLMLSSLPYTGGYPNQQGIPSFGYMTDEQVTQKVLGEASKSGEMNPFMVAGLKMKRGKNLPPSQVANIVGSTTGAQGSYNSILDRMRMNYAYENPEWVGTPFHELAGHRLPDQLPDDFYSQQMPNIQALYETGGSQISPAGVAPYGFDPSQGEMVTSRAAQVRDLFDLNAPIHEGSTGNYGGMDWRNFSDYMQKNPPIVLDEELGYDQELARQYENLARLNRELFGKWEGGNPKSVHNTKLTSFDYGNVPLGEQTWLQDKWGGLRNNPLISEHYLVDRILARNPEMVGTEMELVVENEYNAVFANPNSMLNKISRLGLADEFWDKVEDYITTESEHWSPSRAKAEIQRLLGEQ